MKVNMALMSSENKPQTMDAEDADTDVEKITDASDDADEEEIDESEKHSKVKTLLMIALMVGGFGLFVWNMTSVVNNMRLDNQGYAVNVVREMELNNFMDSSDGSGATTDDTADSKESEVSTDAVRAGPGTETSNDTEPVEPHTDVIIEPSADESEDMAALRKEAEDALNEAALVKQELKNAEDMLDSSLAREAELKSQLDALKNGN